VSKKEYAVVIGKTIAQDQKGQWRESSWAALDLKVSNDYSFMEYVEIDKDTNDLIITRGEGNVFANQLDKLMDCYNEAALTHTGEKQWKEPYKLLMDEMTAALKMVDGDHKVILRRNAKLED
jgi:hypothetical protein